MSVRFRTPTRNRVNRPIYGNLSPSSFLRNLGNIVGATAARNVQNQVFNPSLQQAPRARRLGRGKAPIGGRKRKFKKRKLQYIDKKPKVNKKFKKNFDKCEAIKKNFGKYTYVGNLQLRQVGNDAYAFYENDENGYPIVCGGPRDLADAQAILFGVKTPISDWRVLTGNGDDDSKYFFHDVTMHMEFKSTSSHVVNIELYEITSKVGNNANILTLINEGIASANFGYSYLDAASNSTAGTYSPNVIGSKLGDIPDIWKRVNIKMHKIKLLPGDYTSKFFTVRKRYTANLNMDQTNNVLDTFGKGTKQFAFRVINDISVSGDGANSKIHAFPSNTQGGVAMRYTKTYKCQSPTNLDENKIVVGQWSRTTNFTDQQVAFHQPANTTAFGG